MSKKIVAVTGEYIKSDGTQGANFTDIGVINISNGGKEYALIDPCVNLAGVLLKQNALAEKRGDPLRDMVMCSVMERHGNTGGYNAGPEHQRNNSQRGAYAQARQQNDKRSNDQAHQSSNTSSFDDDIPFS